MATLQELTALYERAVSSPHSRFYRDFFAARPAPSTLAEWRALPLLTKQDIVAVPFDERIFVDPGKVDLVRLTSGTTSANVLAIPRAEALYTEAERDLIPADSYIGFLLPHRVYDNYAKPGTRFIGGDPARLAESAHLAASIEVQAVAGLPSTLIPFAGQLSRVYDINRVRHLCLNGESATKMQRAMLKTLYPGVQTMVSSYGSSETQGLCAISTPYPGYEQALRGHPLVHYEIVDDAGSVIEQFPAEGELVVSIVSDTVAFPLIRYRTGDTALMLESDDAHSIFVLLGRAQTDRIRFSAGSIFVAEMERAITKITKGFVADFEATVREEKTADGARLALSIALISPPLYHASIPLDVASQLEREMRISERGTYRDAVQKGACAPLACTIVGLEYGAGRKRRRLTDAREH